MTEAPVPLPAGLSEALAAVASTERLLVAVDFDGTLAPLVDEPLDARALPESARALAELEVLPRTWVAYVSGRSLEALGHVIPADDLAFRVGSHGVEVQYGARTGHPALTDAERATLERLGGELRTVVQRFPGARLESKSVGFGVHTRGMPAEKAMIVNEAARTAASVLGDFVVREGKDVIEFGVRDATKGDGIERMRAHVDATGVFFAGDDVTDEDAFAVLRDADVGVKVGAGATLARHRVADPAEIGRTLTALAAARSSRPKASPSS